MQKRPKNHRLTHLRALPGAIAGLFVVRLALEVTRRPWPGALVVPLALLAAAGGFACTARLLRVRTESPSTGEPGQPSTAGSWSPAILLIYVLWPRRAPLVAGSTATLALLIWALDRSPPEPRGWVGPVFDGATFVAGIIAYGTTVAPDVLPADAGEFQLVAALLGVAHPPGYPLYTMVGHLFIRLLPWGTPAYRLNLLSGLLAAATGVLISRAVRLWARDLGGPPCRAMAGGLAAALTLGTATTFWAQATIANVRTLAVFLAALALYGLARFATASQESQANRALILLALALGLGGSHYPPLAFVAIFFAGYAVLTDPRLVIQPRRWLLPLLVGLLAFALPLIYLPVRGGMEAPLAPEDLDTWSGFLHHFLARGFGGDMFAFANATDLPHRLALIPTLFPFQFNFGLLALALAGLAGLAWRDRRLFVLLTGSLILHTFVTITYRAPQTVEYLMPAYLPIAVAVGLLPAIPLTPVCSPASAWRHLTSVTLCGLALLAGGLNGWSHAPSFITLATDRSTREAAGPLLEQAPPEALILADWRWATPLWYLQQVEGRRPDVEVRYVYNVPGEEYSDTWERRVSEIPPERPLVLTHAYAFPGYTAEPLRTGFRLHTQPVMEPTVPLTPVQTTFGNLLEVIGYSTGQTEFHPGQGAEFVLAWRAVGEMPSAPSFTLRLVDGAGHHRAQADQRLPMSVLPGEVHFARLVLPLYPDLPPGRYQLTLGTYTSSDAGFETLPTSEGENGVVLSTLDVAPVSRPLFTLHPLSVPFEGGPSLVGVDYDRSVPDVLRAYLHWRGSGEEEIQVVLRANGETSATASLTTIPASAYQTVLVDLPLPAADEPSLFLTFTAGEGGRTAAGPWGWGVRRVRLPTAPAGAQFVPLADEMAVVGATADPAAPGETMAVDVHLVALRPLTSDDGVSVRLMDQTGHWLDRHDIQPGLGGVPTLKWIQGSRVTDRHLLKIPADFTGERVRATLVAYERFRNTTLVPMDGRFDAVPLGSWPVD